MASPDIKNSVIQPEAASNPASEATIKQLFLKRRELLERSRSWGEISGQEFVFGGIFIATAVILSSEVLGALGLLAIAGGILFGGAAAVNRIRAVNKARKISKELNRVAA